MATELEKLIAKHEGLRLKMYKCPAGANTIGYGFNLDENEITKEIADVLLDSRITYYSKFLAREFENWFDPEFTGNRKMAIISMVYNMGIGSFNTFARCKDAIRRGDWNRAANEMIDSVWYSQYPGSSDRVEELADMMRYG